MAPKSLSSNAHIPFVSGKQQGRCPTSHCATNERGSFLLLLGFRKGWGSCPRKQQGLSQEKGDQAKGKYKWRKKEGQETALERKKQRWRRGRERERKEDGSKGRCRRSRQFRRGGQGTEMGERGCTGQSLSIGLRSSRFLGPALPPNTLCALGQVTFIFLKLGSLSIKWG